SDRVGVLERRTARPPLDPGGGALSGRREERCSERGRRKSPSQEGALASLDPRQARSADFPASRLFPTPLGASAPAVRLGRGEGSAALPAAPLGTRAGFVAGERT